MTNRWFVTALAVVLLTAAGVRQGHALDLVRDGRARATIVLPAERNPMTEQAAEYLNRYVERITGTKLSVVREGANQAQTGSCVFLGDTQAGRAVGLDPATLKWDGFRWKVKSGNLYIAGRDIKFPNQAADSYIACRGTLMGVFRLLEEFGGVRWFMPTPKGELVPVSTRFAVPDTLDHKEEPAFAYITPGFDRLGHWSRANGFRVAINLKINSGHSWDEALHNWDDPEELYAEDPTLFAVIGGKRRLGRKLDPEKRITDAWAIQRGITRSGNMLCTSHPDYVPMNVAYFSRLFDEGYDWAEFGASDGFHRCECAKCEAMDHVDEIAGNKRAFWTEADWDVDAMHEGVPSAERLWVPFLEIAKQLYAKYPDKRIMPIAYSPTLIPSQKVKAWPPNVVMELASQSEKYFKAYANVADKTAYVYWWGSAQPAGLSLRMGPHRTARNVRYLVEHGVKGLYVCGGTELFGLEGPAYYVFAKLAWDPNRDVEKVLDEYYAGVYRAAAAPMKQFFALIEERVPIGMKQAGTRYAKKQEHVYGYYPAAYPPEVRKRLWGLLHEAKAAVTSDEYAANWLALTERQFRFADIVTRVFEHYRDWLKDKSPAARQAAEAALAEHRAFLEELTALKADRAYLENWFPQWNKYVRLAPTGGNLNGQLNNKKPFNGKF
ncbi:MAG: DUF4838 domain-containing protein [Kiritimatiellae bacterium]|nr:DUF4838 domain-containing protein [Kiritimatiellia bacterium]